MTDEYQKEVLLRPAVEFYSATVAFVSGALCLFSPGILLIPDAVGLVVGVLAILVGIYDVKRGYRIVRYRRGMNRIRPFVVKSKNLPLYDDKIYIGHGFEWEQKHTQRYLDTFDRKYKSFVSRKEYNLARSVQRNLQSLPVLNLVSKFLNKTWMINPWPPKTALGGDIGLNGVEEDHKEVHIRKPDRLQHTYIAGSTGTGKTEAMEVLITQDIHRKSRDAVIVFDPKGSSSLLKTCYAEAGKAGRLDDVIVFHLGFPEISAMYNATGNYSRVTEIASRLADQLPGDGNAAAFREFGWSAINLVIRASEILGSPPTLVSVRNNVNDIGPMFVEYATKELNKKYGKEWVDSYADQVDEIVEVDKKAKRESERTVDERGMFNLLNNTKYKIVDDGVFNDIVEVYRMSPAHHMKLVASVRPLLDKLTSGQLEMLMSPTEEELRKGRKLLDWEQVIRKRAIVYVGLDAMADFTVASATGNAMLSDMVSTASRIYKHGTFGNIPGGEEETVTTWLYLDEIDAIAGRKTFRSMVNKIRGASISVTAASQTIQDLEVAFNSAAEQKVVIGNFNNLIMFRVRNVETAKLISEQSPKVSVLQLTDITSARDTDNMLDGSFFVSSNEDRATDTSVEMITDPMVMALPTGQAFASLEGGNLYKVRFPLRVKDYDSYLPKDITKLADAMDKRYRAGTDWYQQDDNF